MRAEDCTCCLCYCDSRAMSRPPLRQVPDRLMREEQNFLLPLTIVPHGLLIEAWKPRESVDTANPMEGSPEAALMIFLNAWKARNYGVMAERLGAFDARPLNTRAGQVRAYYEHLILRHFEIDAVNDRAPAVSEIEVRGRGTQYGRSFDSIGTVRLVQMDEDRVPVVYGHTGGVWFVMNWNSWQDDTVPPPDPQKLAQR